MFVQNMDTSQDYDLSQMDYQFDPSFMGGNSLEEIEAWRETVIDYHQRANAVTRLLTGELSAEMADRLTAEMQHIYTTVKSGSYPDSVYNVRWHLLNALADIVLACQERQAENADAVKAYLDTAKIELGFFEIELFRLGIN